MILPCGYVEISKIINKKKNVLVSFQNLQVSIDVGVCELAAAQRACNRRARPARRPRAWAPPRPARAAAPRALRCAPVAAISSTPGIRDGHSPAQHLLIILLVLLLKHTHTQTEYVRNTYNKNLIIVLVNNYYTRPDNMPKYYKWIPEFTLVLGQMSHSLIVAFALNF